MPSKPVHSRLDAHGELRSEYRFDYQASKANRFAKGKRSTGSVVVLDADVAEVFSDSESVNNALRAVISAIPKPRSAK